MPLKHDVPRTASSLLENLELGIGWPRSGANIGSGCSAIDNALKGGLSYGLGGVCCASGNSTGGKNALCFNFLISHLLSSPIAQAFVIDAIGTFDILCLRDGMLSRLQFLDKQAALILAEGNRDGQRITVHGEPQSAAESMLQRVRIMRVFDFTGLTESLTEIEQIIRSDGDGISGPEDNKSIEARASKVVDRQDQTEDKSLLQQGPTVASGDVKALLPSKTATNGPLILVDSISRLISPLMKTNHIRGHSLLTSLLRSLTDLTRSHNLSIILTNAAISSSPYESNATSRATVGAAKPTAGSSVYGGTLDKPSIFAAVEWRPALGKTFPHFLDLHLFVSEVLEGPKEGPVNVMEVLADRWQGRTGRWAAFEVENGVLLKGLG